MTADEFVSDPVLGRSPSPIDEILEQWNKQGKCFRDDATGMVTMLAVLGLDAAIGDGLLNQIPPELQAAMEHLMDTKADTYDEARHLIEHSLAKGDASFAGFVNKIKGQIGEDRFVAQYPEYALATSHTQEAIDAIKHLPDGTIEATQVKMYASAHAVVDHMRIVREKVANDLMVEGEHISKLNFAVPDNIANQVRSEMARYPELENIDVVPINSTAADVGNVVLEAGDHIDNPVGYLASDVIESVACMAALDALTNVYLVAKGRKSVADVVQEAAIKTPIGALAIFTSKGMALALTKAGLAASPIVIPLLAAVATRQLSRRWYENRCEFSKYMRDEGEWSSLLATAIANKNVLFSDHSFVI